MTRRLRLDAELVRRGLAHSRGHAAELVNAGRVSVSGATVRKPASGVTTDAAVVVQPDPDSAAAAGRDYASRGGHKLAGALRVFGEHGLRVAGRRCLDAGASTGGFTDVLLRAGARQVICVDVGYGQLAWPLRQDDRTLVLDRTNVRDLAPDQVGGRVDLVVADLSFISLRLVVGSLAGMTRAGGDLVLMVKPQFEVGRERLGRRGVVREPGLHVAAVSDVAESAAARGWGVRRATASSLPGPAGNIEYFLWLRDDADTGVEWRRHTVTEAVATGPAGVVRPAPDPETDRSLPGPGSERVTS